MSHSVAQAYNFRFDYASGAMGPFLKLQVLHPNPLDIPWCNSANKARELDYMYLGNRSGDKPSAPLIEKFIELATYDYLNPEQMATLAGIYYDMYVPQLNKMWEALNDEYDPLENYSMLEELTDDYTTITHGKTTTRTGSVEMTPEAVMTVESSVYAFDSSSPSPDAKTVSTPEGSNTTEYNDLTDTEGGTTETEHGYTKTRSGNIGVTTSQQMLQQELEIRQHDFYLTAFQFMDKILTIPVY